MDGFVSLGVVASAIVVSLGAEIGDLIIALAITLVILRITWQSWRAVTTTDLSEMIEPPPLARRCRLARMLAFDRDAAKADA